MASTNWVILAPLALITLVYCIPDYSDLPPGPYCARTGCCDGRRDSCSSPIIGTLCYCDDFCNRTRSEDCCPDFWSHCKHIQPPPIPEPIRTCFHNGQYYYIGKTTKRNCNICKCENLGGKMEMLCEDNKCLIDSEIINTVNQKSGQYGWEARNHTPFWGHTLQEGITHRLGTLQPHRFVLRMHPVRSIYEPSSLPKSFDAEEMWPGKISRVQDQGWCGSSWAISTAAVASDRYSVMSGGMENPQLSAQHLVSCDNRGQQSCNGGYLDKAWMYIRKYGIVNEECFPYTGKNEKCRIPRKGNLLTARCGVPRNVDRKDYYRVAPAYRLGNETDIMLDIMKSGPVQATMVVYHDFFMYSGGIYKKHPDLSESHRTGYHSVRIVGWGEEFNFPRVVKYWKVANSWGNEWGENGYFRIIRGQNHCEIESFVLATWPDNVRRWQQ